VLRRGPAARRDGPGFLAAPALVLDLFVLPAAFAMNPERQRQPARSRRPFASGPRLA